MWEQKSLIPYPSVRWLLNWYSGRLQSSSLKLVFVELKYLLVPDHLHSYWTFFLNDSFATDEGALVQWLKLPTWIIGDRGLEPHPGLQLKKKNVYSPHTRKDSILWGASVIEGSVLGLRPFESCILRAVSSHSSHYPKEVLVTQFNLYVHKDGIKPHLLHFTVMTDGLEMCHKFPETQREF